MSNSNIVDNIRNKNVLKINDKIENIKISRYIEKDIYNSCIKLSLERNIKRNWNNIIFKNLYMNRIISIISNIDKDSYIKNDTFLNRIFNGDIDYKNISKISNVDMYPEAWQELINKKTKIDKLKYEKNQTAMTSLFKCSKCKSNKCSYYEVQTRSADEPMTQFITCIECGNRWKE